MLVSGVGGGKELSTRGTTIIPTPIDIPNRGPVGGEEMPVPIAHYTQ